MQIYFVFKQPNVTQKQILTNTSFQNEIARLTQHKGQSRNSMGSSWHEGSSQFYPCFNLTKHTCLLENVYIYIQLYIVIYIYTQS